ncbi:unnamed protein product, partial [Brassica oleracea]
AWTNVVSTSSSARSLHSDRAEWTLGCYVATELWLEVGRYVATERNTPFRKEESISKKYLSKKVFRFSSSGIWTLTSL